MPDFYDMHVALCREKRTPKRPPASPTATLLLLTLAPDFLDVERFPSLLSPRAWR